MLNSFRALKQFEAIFAGRVYRHRSSNQGNAIGRECFEDIFEHSVSSAFPRAVADGRLVVNVAGKLQTPILVRRNDSLCGRPPAGVTPRKASVSFSVPEGPVAEPQIWCEVKILAKSQQKQLDRVIGDLERFAEKMKALNPTCLTVAIVGVNHESNYVGYEGKRKFRNKLREHEAAVTASRVRSDLHAKFTELIVLDFLATNQKPFPFSWVNPKSAELEYGAALTRLGAEYDRRFSWALTQSAPRSAIAV